MDELQRASAAIAAGNKGEAHQLLAQAIKADPNNVDAWLLLSQTAALPEQQKTFLKRVLIIDPDNQTAKSRLEVLETETREREAPEQLLEEPPQQDEPALPESPAPSEADVTVVSEAAAPWPGEEADTVVVQAPQVMLTDQPEGLVEQEMGAGLLEPDAVFSDPFEFDSQSDTADVPDWLIGEVAPAEVPWGEPEATEETELPPTDQPESLVEASAPLVESSPAPDSAETAPQAVAARPAKQEEPRKAAQQRRNTWLEWLAALAFLILFLLLVFFLVGGL